MKRIRYKTGYAHTASEAKHSKLWKGLLLAYAPTLGHTGTKLRDLKRRYVHGAFQNGAGWTTSRYGPVIDLDDGSSHWVDLMPAAEPILAGLVSTDWSIAMWVRINTHANYDGLVVFDDDGLVLEANNTICVMRGGATGSGLPCSEHGIFPGLNGEWIHLVGTTSGIYINGKPSSGSDVNDSGYNRTDKYEIGRGFGDSTTDMTFADVLIYDRVLRQSEAKLLYRLRPGGWLEAAEPVIGKVPAAGPSVTLHNRSMLGVGV